MNMFQFQYRLPNATAPFSTIKGGVSLVSETLVGTKRPSHALKASGQIDWLLRDQNTSEVFSARQILGRSPVGQAGAKEAAVQSECPLFAGHVYETLEVSAPALQESEVRQPDQRPITDSPLFGFAAGTHIMTMRGEIPVEELNVGDRVVTRDRGMQTLRWIGSTTQTVRHTGAVTFSEGVIKNGRDLTLCASQRVVLKGTESMMRFGKREILAEAHRFLDGEHVVQSPSDDLQFFRLLLDQHEVIYAEAAACDSFLPSSGNLSALDESQQQEIHSIFPELAADPASYGPMARCHVGWTTH